MAVTGSNFNSNFNLTGSAYPPMYPPPLNQPLQSAASGFSSGFNSGGFNSGFNGDSLSLSSPTPSLPTPAMLPAFNSLPSSFPGATAASPVAPPPPQVIYVPVQTPPQPITPAAVTSTPKPTTLEGTIPVSDVPAAKPIAATPSDIGVTPEFPSDPMAPLTPKLVGQRIGSTVEQLLESNPEIMDDVDRLNLDDPNALLKQLHGAFHPLIKWVPNTILDKATTRMPLEWQGVGGRLLDWFNTPPEQLKPLGGGGPGSVNSAPKPHPMSKQSAHKESPLDHRSPLDDLASDPTLDDLTSDLTSDSPSRLVDKSPLADDPFALDEAPADKPSLMDRVKHPMDLLPGRKKEQSPFDELVL